MGRKLQDVFCASKRFLDRLYGSLFTRWPKPSSGRVSHSGNMGWKLKLTFEGKNKPGGVRPVAFSPDGQWVASTEGDHIIMVWNVVDGTVRFTLDSKTSEYMSFLIFSPTGRFLASVSWDWVRIWDLDSGECVRERRGFEESGTPTFSEMGDFCSYGHVKRLDS